MSSATLSGQVAFITGAGSGLGAAFARRLAADGAAIVVNDRSPDAAAAVAAEVGGDVAVFDVTDSEAFDAEIDKTVARHGRLDIVINNAGIAPPLDEERFERGLANQMLRMEGRIADMAPMEYLTTLSDEDWDRMIKVHLYGAFYGTRAALRHMQAARSGSIVNVSSILGQQPSAGAVHYSAAKAAIIALTRSAALETAHLGIRINAVCPGYVDTPLLSHFNDLVKGAITMRIAMGRMGRAEELAELVRFLAGPESSYCTGDIFTASGGYA
jgi:3-oxoacyl-[acyl-carrier protein] reductase